MNNSLKLMRARLNHMGGISQQDRIISDKRDSLNQAILYSYQSASVRKAGSEKIDRALINPNTVKQDYDDKVISIGYEYEYKPGTIFEWVNTGTKWLVYLQDLTELAYFRGDIRKCSYNIKWKNEQGEEMVTAAAVVGPKEASLNSSEKNGVALDMPNHSLSLMLPATPEVLGYFKRYSKFYLQPLKEGDTPICWRVEATDTISMPGILELNAVEFYVNEQTDDTDKGLPDAVVEEIPEPQDKDIVGNTFIKPKKSYVYEYKGDAEGSWSYDTRLPIEATINGKEVIITWTKTYSGEFVLQYADSGKTIVVESLF